MSQAGRCPTYPTIPHIGDQGSAGGDLSPGPAVTFTCPPARKAPVSYPYQQPSGYQNQAIYHLSLIEHIGAVIFFSQRSYTVTGTLEQCEQAYRRAQTHNLAAGWWSVMSLLLLNWIALFSNHSAIRKVRALAQQPHAPAQLAAPSTPPGWYPDPSGQPVQRYWDGGTWTHWTHPPSHR
ncbi:DUF2510 domain-containing protein [Mycobacterium kubicae]|uniref:DUF2510 domain-containing protein n=1 Tax=Mycobacterium kubicae TaxID=120959 RepID=A0AAX1JJ52_9MYCO|nr:DUF2510 domain-containing protein [Mycobacterium kubicae]QNI14635.1 DUF2510 domain-containing protein [Mycobacterium kubicae]QPI40556.1 DUF2510 domain-containing protein [Mycobacterium kubicae]